MRDCFFFLLVICMMCYHFFFLHLMIETCVSLLSHFRGVEGLEEALKFAEENESIVVDKAAYFLFKAINNFIEREIIETTNEFIREFITQVIKGLNDPEV